MMLVVKVKRFNNHLLAFNRLKYNFQLYLSNFQNIMIYYEV